MRVKDNGDKEESRKTGSQYGISTTMRRSVVEWAVRSNQTRKVPPKREKKHRRQDQANREISCFVDSLLKTDINSSRLYESGCT